MEMLLPKFDIHQGKAVQNCFKNHKNPCWPDFFCKKCFTYVLRNIVSTRHSVQDWKIIIFRPAIIFIEIFFIMESRVSIPLVILLIKRFSMCCKIEKLNLRDFFLVDTANDFVDLNFASSGSLNISSFDIYSVVSLIIFSST